MAIKVKMLSDRRNQNHMRVTAAFIQQVAADQAHYIGTPLVVDKPRLERGEYARLTHLQDERSGGFSSDQIGSFVRFETIREPGGETVLIGTARVEKRFERACAAIRQLYEMDKLRVSFEIMASVFEQTPEELVIDAADGNSLIGMCIVSLPAYEDARALALVASASTEKQTQKERMEEMPEETKKLPAADGKKEGPVPPESEREEKNKEKELPESKPAQRRTAEAEATPDPAMERLKTEMESLKEANEQLAQFKEKWEAAEAARLEAEKQERRRRLSELIVTVGLKPEAYQAEISEMDYPAIIPAVLKALREQQGEQPAASVMAAAMNGLVQANGVTLGGGKPDHPYRRLVKDLTI